MVVMSGKVVRLLEPRDEATGYSVFRFFPEEEVICDNRHQVVCHGIVYFIAPGLPLRIHAEHESGCRYQVVSVEILTDKKSYSMYFLEKVKGISVKTASRLLAGLDNDIGKLLSMEDPLAYLEKIPGSARYRDDLLENLQGIFKKEPLYTLLLSKGFEFGQAARLESIYGANALEAVQSDPYTACEKAGVHFYIADFLAREYGKNRLSVERIHSIIRETLRYNEERGNTRISMRDFMSGFNAILKKSAWPWSVSPVYVFAVMNEMQDILVKDKKVCFVRRYLQEESIVRNLCRLDSFKPQYQVTDEDIMQVEQETGIQYLESQKMALNALGKNSIVVMLGKPGTGKTTTVQGMIKLFEKLSPDAGPCFLCAPTARAAQVMKEASGHPASTIHKMVGIVPYGDSFLGHNENDPLPCGLLIVDEMSMVDTETFYLLLRAVRTGCQLVLCGDQNQLESVGCGAVFRDIIQSGLFGTVTLNEVMRQAEGSSIIKNCDRILNGSPDLCQDDDFQVIYFAEDGSAAESLEKRYQKSDTEQILTPTKQGEIGTRALNQRFGKHTRDPGILFRGNHYCVGDKVVFTENNYDKGFYNGDIGVITEIACSVRISVDSQEVVLGKQELGCMEPAAAMTIHKSQGSQYNVVHIMLPREPAVLLTRNLLNTAISRAKEKVFLYVVGNALEITASDRMRKERETWLSEIFAHIKK